MAAMFSNACSPARRTLMQRVTAQWPTVAFASSSRQPALPLVSTSASLHFNIAISESRPQSEPVSAVERWQSLWVPAQETLAGLRDLLPPWLLAAPKRRTTHSAKRMRHSNKGLKEKHRCGAPKLAHHLCHDCHVGFRQEIHAEAKQRSTQRRTDEAQ
ncbi:hypothetical protein OIV83_000771 [Microbotryomycetes sp. JL201]|nr:hypothetical protein OIV83_000771 [Microbotryomycetes sp. JL201]